MRRPDRVAAVALASLAGLLLAAPAFADEPGTATGVGTGVGTGVVRVDDAVLRWGLDNESSNRAFAPHTYNFFSAGLVPDPGKGGTTLPRKRWQQQAGAVSIQKWDGSAWRPATWAGLATDSADTPLGSPTAGTFSNHRFVIDGGTGTVDPAAGTAHIAWDGDVTVLYYSGMSFFHLSDPVLDVADGVGTLTATVQGYASSVSDPDSWDPVPITTVTVADLPDVDLGGDRGFTATPAYLGVAVDGLDQVRSDEWFGAFPQSFVDYMDRLGTAAFWLSSGGSTDAFKVAMPLSVAYDASVAQPDPTPAEQPTQTPIVNPVVPPPVTVTTTVTAPAVPAPPAAAPSAAPPPAAAPAALPAASQLVAAAPAAAPVARASTAASPGWWVGGGLLLLTALTLLVPIGRPGRVTS